ncbi:MAG: RNA polymerase factor sigma-54 [Pseudomonadota bacterium]
MALAPKLQLRQSQSLVMTPQLMQAIKLLQLGHADLAAYVDAELEKNPLLERDGDDASSGSDDSDPSPQQGAESSETDLVAAQDQDLGTLARDLDADASDAYEADAAAVRPAASERQESSLRWSGTRGGGPDGDSDPMAQLTGTTSLRDHLEEQLAIAAVEPVDRMIGTDLIDQVDETGYFRGDLDEVAARLGTPRERVDGVLKIIQGFEPTGVMARDLAECLELQLREQDRFDPAMAALVANLALLAKRDLASLRRLCGVDDEDLTDMIGEIRALDPKPGLAFGGEPVRPVVPDVIVTQGRDGGWRVELNSDTLPKVLVNETYRSTLGGGEDGETKTYVSTCLQEASWLIKSLDQRARTIIKVSEELVRQQDKFLLYGVEHLRPLNLKTIAEKIDMHESTVSRVTSNKFISTPRGLFEFRYFFTNAIAATEGGDAHSSESVRFKIKEMIDGEPEDAILSDDQIVSALRSTGVDIARRTVAKYRDLLGIPSSVQRRREKAVAL